MIGACRAVKQQGGPQLRAATTPLRSVLHRFAYVLLICAAFGLMLVGKADTILIERMRAGTMDAINPILDMASRPVASMNELIDRARAFSNIYEENLRLREENSHLLAWQTAARKLEAENTELRQVLNYRDVPAPRFITTRIVADMGSTFVHSLLLTAGKREGVVKGQAVIGDAGLIGRIAESGWRASRALLITDINSRIPVLVERSGDRGILSGDNTDRPQLIRLPQDSSVAPGDRIVTSGHGGAFPQGVPIGLVTSVTENGIRVEPFTRRHRISMVRVADYSLSGILADPLVGRELEADVMPVAPLTPEQRRQEALEALKRQRRPQIQTAPPRLYSMEHEEAATATLRDVSKMSTEYGP
jgi:rod shape-determining protein MreC